MRATQENEAQIKDVAAKLRGSIEALCDKLKDNPNVAENMAKVASERQGLQGLLARGLEQLQSMRRFPCIAEAVMSEQSRCVPVRVDFFTCCMFCSAACTAG